MPCPEFEAALQDAADRRALPPCDAVVPGDAPDELRALWRHADACPRCRSVWRQLGFVDDALRSWGRQAFDVDLTDAVMARWRSERDENENRAVAAVTAAVTAAPPVARPGRSASRVRAAVYAVAIASLLAVLIGPPRWLDPTETTHRPDPPDGPGQPAAPGHEAAPRAAEGAAAAVAGGAEIEIEKIEPVPWGRLVENAGAAYRIVADDTAETWTGVKQLVSAWTPLPGPADEPSSAGSGTETGDVEPWLDDLRRDWQPVGRDMARPLEFLREALPDSSATL